MKKYNYIGKISNEKMKGCVRINSSIYWLWTTNINEQKEQFKQTLEILRYTKKLEVAALENMLKHSREEFLFVVLDF